MISGHNFIGFEKKASGEKKLYAFSTVQKNNLTGEFAVATEQEINAAIAKATSAFEIYKRTSFEERAEFLDTIADEIMQLEELIERAHLESGLPEGRITNERGRTVGQLKLFASLLREGSYVEAIIDTALPERKPLPRSDLRRMMHPIGPVAVFAASNFPLAFSTAGGDTASALAAGCPVVVKGHPSHPGTGELVARELEAAVADAGLPDGTFAHLLAAGIEVGEALVDAPAIAAVGFTGSTAGGRAIFDRATRRPVPIPVYAEMGSVNPIVVTEAALAARGDAIADGLVASVASFGGQLCTKPGVVFVPAGEEGDAFASDLGARLSASEPQVLLNERLRDAPTERVAELDGLAEPVGGAATAAEPGFRFHPAAYRAAA